LRRALSFGHSPLIQRVQRRPRTLRMNMTTTISPTR